MNGPLTFSFPTFGESTWLAGMKLAGPRMAGIEMRGGISNSLGWMAVGC